MRSGATATLGRAGGLVSPASAPLDGQPQVGVAAPLDGQPPVGADAGQSSGRPKAWQNMGFAAPVPAPFDDVDLYSTVSIAPRLPPAPDFRRRRSVPLIRLKYASNSNSVLPLTIGPAFPIPLICISGFHQVNPQLASFLLSALRRLRFGPSF